MRRTPRTAQELAALEAEYQPFEPVAAWAGRGCDTERWQRHVDDLRTIAQGVDPDIWHDLRERFLRAAALDSSVLSELVRPMPDVTAVVLSDSLSDAGWRKVAESTDLVIECHRRALVVAADTAADGRLLDEHLIALLQDIIVEAQQTYTVTVEDGTKREVDLPRRQYKPVSNYLRKTNYELTPFAPAAEVAAEMQRFAAELATAEFDALHPVIRGAYLHATLTHIHPFSDGNGRLARTLASLPLLREAGLPQLLLVDQWPAYLSALHREDEGDPQAMIDLFLSAQINTTSLAASLLRCGAPRAQLTRSESAPPATAERMLLDLVTVQLRELLVGRLPGHHVAVTTVGPDPARRLGVRAVVVDDQGRQHVDVVFRAAPDRSDPRWSQLVASTGEFLEACIDDLLPVPVEIVRLRVISWLNGVFRDEPVTPSPALPDSASIRALFVLGAPRSGTTVMGDYLGSHPAVLGLAEYGGFYVAHSVAPAYLVRLPGHEHDGFTASLGDLAAEHASRVARAEGCTWYCDATPWNLEVAGQIVTSVPDALFVLMVRHFSGTVLSLSQFGWAGASVESAARLWVTLNACVEQLPMDRTIVVGYDALTADPVATLAGIHEAFGSLGLAADQFDAVQFARSHAAIIGRPRPTVAELVDGQVIFRAIPSLDEQQWTPDVHELVWPIVAETHRALRDTFAGAYIAPPRPDHVPPDQW